MRCPNPVTAIIATSPLEKYSRAALINQGFDVCEIDISHGDTIPSLINIMVLAEMRTPLTEKRRKSTGSLPGSWR